MSVTVKNVKTERADWQDPRNVYCGRGRNTDLYGLGLGNPYPMERGEDVRHWRNRVCNLVKQDVDDALRLRSGELWHKLVKLSIILTQQGELNLWCFCAPERCHADEYKRAVLVLEDEFDAWCRSTPEDIKDFAQTYNNDGRR